jgi:hypothetical protein
MSSTNTNSVFEQKVTKETKDEMNTDGSRWCGLPRTLFWAIPYRVKMVIRGFAVLILVATVAIWATLGAKVGWTQTSVEVRTEDPVTGIEGVTYRDQFVPGVEFLSVGVLGAGLIFAFTLFVPITKPKNS